MSLQQMMGHRLLAFHETRNKDFNRNVSVAPFVSDDQNTQKVKKNAGFTRTTQNMRIFSR